MVGMGLFAWLDTTCLEAVNAFVGRSPAFDAAVRVLADWNFIRSFWLAGFLIWAWFALVERDVGAKIVSGLMGLIAATALSRLLQLIVPLHARPFNYVNELALNVPPGLDVHWGYASSFPSDTATLHFALAAIILSLSRTWGVFAFLWVSIVIALPRVYILYHWPSDILAGLLLGVSFVAAAQHYRASIPTVARILDYETLKPQLFYPVFFVLLYQIVDSFGAVEVALHEVSSLAKLFAARTI